MLADEVPSQLRLLFTPIDRFGLESGLSLAAHRPTATAAELSLPIVCRRGRCTRASSCSRPSGVDSNPCRPCFCCSSCQRSGAFARETGAGIAAIARPPGLLRQAYPGAPAQLIIRLRERRLHGLRVPHAARAELVEARSRDAMVATAARLSNHPGVVANGGESLRVVSRKSGEAQSVCIAGEVGHQESVRQREHLRQQVPAGGRSTVPGGDRLG